MSLAHLDCGGVTNAAAGAKSRCRRDLDVSERDYIRGGDLDVSEGETWKYQRVGVKHE